MKNKLYYNYLFGQISLISFIYVTLIIFFKIITGYIEVCINYLPTASIELLKRFSDTISFELIIIVTILIISGVALHFVIMRTQE